MPLLRVKPGDRPAATNIEVTKTSLWSAKTHDIRIEAHPFDQGYWARFFGLPRPTIVEQRKGWDACDAEIAAEAAQGEQND